MSLGALLPRRAVTESALYRVAVAHRQWPEVFTARTAGSAERLT
ncbi:MULTISPECIES: hypothetical protein [Actinomyces]|nr:MULTISPECIES: hypothetical protein [Actinomyces]